MIANYITIAFRYLLKNRTFSLINIFGLTLGFLCFILIALYLHDELSFDRFHPDADRTYRVLQHETTEDGSLRVVAGVAPRIAPEAIKQMPEVDDAVRTFVFGRTTMGNDPAMREYEPIMTADANFFTFFNFPLVAGDAATALQSPDAVVISERLATKYFGSTPALGKRLWTAMTRNNQYVEVTVTGVMKNFPKNSNIQTDIIFSDKTWSSMFTWYDQFMATDWKSNSFTTYLKLKNGADLAALESKLTTMVKTNYPADKTFSSTYSLQGMGDIHLYSDNIQGNQGNANGSKPIYLYMFAGVGVLILLIAALNYMNLSTAAAFKRTREIGTRKTLGAQRSQLVSQFTGEAIILSAISLLIALSLLQATLPVINLYTEKELALRQLPWEWFVSILAIVMITGMLSTLYPAYVITKVMPAEAMKKIVKLGGRSLPMRKTLVVAQFCISIVMIASTLVIYKQLGYIRNKELGFNLSNLLVVDINSDRLRRNFETIKAEFAKLPEIESVSTSTRVPGEWKTFPIATVKTGDYPSGTDMIYVGIDQDFMSTYNIKLLAGRNFDGSRGDSTKVILTKLAVEQLNLKDPIGQVIEIPTVRWGGSIEQLDKPFRVEVIGVADNFHFESFRCKMMPLVFAYPNTGIQRIDYYTLRVNTQNWDETLKKLKAVNTAIDADNPLEYNFLDSQFEKFYKADVKRGQMFLVFSCIIVLIACLGLFALVSFSMESRTKEIGIRKVMGASVESIVGLVSREFLMLVVIASFIAIPLAYYAMARWLEEFAYHIDPSAEVFLLAGIIALAIAFVTIGFRAVKAALANPVKSLRSE